MEEGLIVSLVIGLFLLHVRSALVIVLSIPVAVLIAFILMHLLGISSNIMSLGGVAIAIGVLVDAAIVMVENAYRHLAEPGVEEDVQDVPGRARDFTQTILHAAKQVGRPIFFSLLIILLSFSPVFLLTGQEGKLFHPLAATKSFSMAAAALLSITLVPVLMTFLLRGRLKPEQKNPISRLFIGAYRPVLGLALRFKKITLAIALVVLVLAVPLARSIGNEFMPPLDEGSLLFMPTMLPDINLTEAKRIVQEEDRILASFPEVANVLGKVGRADTATDPAPVSMIETIVTLKPRGQWPNPRLSKDELIARMDARLQIPGVSNGWTQPIINRINMLSTGVRTDLGLKIYGSNLQTIENLGIRAEAILKQVPGSADVYADRVVGGRYLNIVPNRWAIARYGLSVGDVQQVIEAAIGGMTVTNTVEGRDRFPVRVRYARDFRADPTTLGQVLVPTPAGAQIPLAELADITVTDGPPMISSENALLDSIVYLNVRGRDMGSFVQAATQALDKNLKLPPGYYYGWSGQYENQIHAQRRLEVVVPLAIGIILLFLYFTFRDWTASLLVIL
ncbi:MAG TPA: efflux RND transporter permease subunit, partial [Oscillatoriaceae cyanobacterium]